MRRKEDIRILYIWCMLKYVSDGGDCGFLWFIGGSVNKRKYIQYANFVFKLIYFFKYCVCIHLNKCMYNTMYILFKLFLMTKRANIKSKIKKYIKKLPQGHII